jgi:ribosome-binding ATPase
VKIGFSGLELPEGSVKYEDDRVAALVEKEQPKKVTPFYVEFVRDEFNRVDAIAISEKNRADLIIADTEMFENRLGRAENAAEKALLEKCISGMEKEILLCDMEFSEEEHKVLRMLNPVSYNPVVVAGEEYEVNEIIKKCLDKSGTTFFYTSGKSEVHAWHIKKNSDIVTCAGKIHKDLARGFIKGDVIRIDEYLTCHSMNDAKQKGLVRVVDRDYKVQEDEIIEIRFAV